MGTQFNQDAFPQFFVHATEEALGESVGSVSATLGGDISTIHGLLVRIVLRNVNDDDKETAGYDILVGFRIRIRFVDVKNWVREIVTKVGGAVDLVVSPGYDTTTEWFVDAHKGVWIRPVFGSFDDVRDTTRAAYILPVSVSSELGHDGNEVSGD
jgi:hypothetical protein